MTAFILHNIDTSYECYLQFITLYHQNKDKFLDDITISFDQWFAANMSSVLGGILDKLVNGLNTIKFDVTPPSIKTIIQKNDFLSHYGYERVADYHNPTSRL